MSKTESEISWGAVVAVMLAGSTAALAFFGALGML